MATSRYFYTSGEMESYMSFTENDEINNLVHDEDEEEEEDDDDSDGFLQDVPYSSSSVDRSSIGSIPWADDAIKKNQLDWEMVERMLSGQEPLGEELDLRNEILEWQQKFPQLLSNSNKGFPSNEGTHFDTSLDVDTLSNISADSDNGGDDEEDLVQTATPTNHSRNMLELVSHKKTPSVQQQKELAEILDRDLHISSMPLNYRQRNWRQLSNGSSSSSSSSVVANSNIIPTPSHQHYDASPSKSLQFDSLSASASAASVGGKHNRRIYMPPILNSSLDAKRRFYVPRNNQSFVQLTQIHQAKSAAAIRLDHHQTKNTSWKTPFANNRNSIILPAISVQESKNLDLSTGSAHKPLVTSASRSNFGSGNFRQRQQLFSNHHYDFSLNSHLTTPSTGRSISAAVHHQRLNPDFYPYSASKYKGFK